MEKNEKNYNNNERNKKNGINSLLIGISAILGAAAVTEGAFVLKTTDKLYKNQNAKIEREENNDKQKSKSDYINENYTIGSNNDLYDKSEGSTQIFEAYEHAVYVTIPKDKDVRKNSFRYEYHAGYKPVKIQIDSYGDKGEYFGGGYVKYENIEPVRCKSNLIGNDDKHVYLDFGTPVLKNEDKYKYDENNDIYDAGQHIISIPVSSTEYNDFSDFENGNESDGYKLVGISGTYYESHSDMDSHKFAGGVALYMNITPVAIDEEKDSKSEKTYKDYTEFGTPTQKKVKELSIRK